MSASGTSGYTNLQRASIMLSTMLGFAFDVYDLLIFPFVMPSIQRSLDFTLWQVASITSVTLVGSTLGGLYFGWLADRIGRRTTLQITLVLVGVGAVLSAMSQGFWSLSITRFLAGLGLGGEWAAGIVLFNEVWSRERRGLGSAIIQGSAVFGTASVPIVATWAIGTYGDDLGWRISLLTGAAPLLLAALIRIFVPESAVWKEENARRKNAESEDESIPALQSVKLLLRPPHLLTFGKAMLWAMSFMYFYYGMATFMPTLMLETMKTPPEVVRSLILVASVTGGIAFLCMGWVNDTFGRRFGSIVPALMWIIAAAGFYAYGDDLYAGSLIAWPFFWLYLCYSIGTSGVGVFGPWLSELFPTEIRATATSAVYMIGRGAGATAPLFIPLIAESSGSLLIGMLSGAPCILIYLLLTFLMKETAGRRFRGGPVPAT